MMMMTIIKEALSLAGSARLTGGGSKSRRYYATGLHCVCGRRERENERARRRKARARRDGEEAEIGVESTHTHTRSSVNGLHTFLRSRHQCLNDDDDDDDVRTHTHANQLLASSDKLF
jgi:hypothetical protein